MSQGFLNAAACPQCGGWTESGGMSQHAKGPAGCKCHRIRWCTSCGCGKTAEIAPGVLRCLHCGHEMGWPVCQACEAGDVVDGTCVQCGTREV